LDGQSLDERSGRVIQDRRPGREYPWHHGNRSAVNGGRPPCRSP